MASRFTLPEKRNSLNRDVIWALSISILWLALVIYTTSQHEVFRDEVRAWSLAKTAHTPLDLYHVSKFDGHPVLWFFLLYVGTLFTDSPIILHIISIAVAFSAVLVFMLYAPFPLWLRTLFIFSGLPVYEYSVMARNYGISMLILFLVAATFAKRKKYPLLIVSLFALLANTNIFGLMISGILAGIWLWDLWQDKKAGKKMLKMSTLIYSLLIFIAGITISMVFIGPRENSNLVSEGLPINPGNLVYVLVQAILRPDLSFAAFFPSWFNPFVKVSLLYLAIFGLVGKPRLMVAAFVSQTLMSAFFQFFLIGSYRHQGIYLILLVILYWITLSEIKWKSMTRFKRNLMYAGLYIGLLMLILGNLARAKAMILRDIQFEYSSGKALGEFLNDNSSLKNAIILAEPDFHMETLPYYADNPIYLPREHRFGNTVSWSFDSDSLFSLGGLLTIARSIKQKNDQPVLIVIGLPVELTPYDDEIRYPYIRKFSWNHEAFIDFDTSTVLLRDFNQAYAHEENYKVYLLKE